MRAVLGVPLLMLASVAGAQVEPYRDASGELWYFLWEAAIWNREYDPSAKAVCELWKLRDGKNPFSDSCPGRHCKRRLRASPSGRYVAVAGVIPHDHNPDPANANLINDYRCEQYDLDTPACDAVLGVIDLKRCRLVGVANLHYTGFPDNDTVHYFFSNDERILLSDDHLYTPATPLTKVFSVPELRPVGQYPVRLGLPDMETSQAAYCFANDHCAFWALSDPEATFKEGHRGWAVINTRSGKLIASRLDFRPAELKRDGTSVGSPPLSRSRHAIAQEGEILVALEPLWVDGSLWIQYVRTEKREKGEAIGESRAFLVSVRDFDATTSVTTQLPAGSGKPRLQWDGPKTPLCVLDAEQGEVRVPVALPPLVGPERRVPRAKE